MTLLSTTALTGIEMLLLVGIGLANLLTIEIIKFFFFERDYKKHAKKQTLIA
jgi:hypothetical protein